jgi:hypothetical protein
MFRQSIYNRDKHRHINFLNKILTRDSRTLTNRFPDSAAKNNLQNFCPKFLHDPSFLLASQFPFPLFLTAIVALLSFLSYYSLSQRIRQEQKISCGRERGKEETLSRFINPPLEP